MPVPNAVRLPCIDNSKAVRVTPAINAGGGYAKGARAWRKNSRRACMRRGS